VVKMALNVLIVPLADTGKLSKKGYIVENSIEKLL